MARANLTAYVGLNATSFQRGLRSMRRRWRAFRSTVVGPMARFGANMGRAFVRGAVIMGAAFAFAIKHANGFRNQMALVNTMLDGQDLEKYTEGILKMSGRFGMAKDSLTKGLYDIFSAGVAAEDGMKFLEVATRAAIGGATDTATAVDALTTIMNAYGMQAKEVGHVSDVTFQIIKDGKITYAELAENIGKLAPTAKAAGLSLEQLGAAVATIVKTEDPARAMTSLRQAMFQAAEDGQNLFELAKRFEGVNLEGVIAAGINKKTAAGVVILANNFNVLMGEIEKFKDVSGRATDAFEKMDKVRHWARLWQTLLSTMTRVGIVLDKTLGPAINYLRNQLDKLTDTPGFKKFLERVQTATKTLTGALIAMARGGEGRKLAREGFRKVLIGSFMIAMKAAIDLLLKAAPKIGAIIGGVATAFVDNQLNKAASKAAAKEIITGQFEAEGRSIRTRGFSGNKSVDNTEEFNQRVKDLIRQGNALAIKLEFEFAKNQFPDKKPDETGREKLAAGRDLLKQAAALATQDLKEFQDAITEPLVKGEGIISTSKEFSGDLKEKPVERRFSELRSIGANIIGAGAPKKKTAELIWIRQALAQDLTNKLLKLQAEDLHTIAEAAEDSDGSATF